MSWRRRLAGGMAAWFVVAIAAAPIPGSVVDAATPSVALRLPYDASDEVRWSGGPHVYDCATNCLLSIADDTLNLYTTGEGSGLDFSNGGDFDVLAMVAGHVIYASGQAGTDQDPVACSATGFGCRVVTRLADGTILVYAHLEDGSVAFRQGDDVRQGDILGEAGDSGDQEYVHLHVEWRDGTGTWPDGSDGSCASGGTTCYYGNPIGWDGHPVGLDGYRIWPFLCTDAIADPGCTGDGDVAYDYDGSATRGDVSLVEDCAFNDGVTGTTARHATVRVDATYQGSACNDSPSEAATQFAGSGVIGAGAGAGSDTFVAVAADPGGGYLVSTNRRLGSPDERPPTSTPKVSWSGEGTKQSAHVAFGEPVQLAAKVRDATELRFTVYYADWPDERDDRSLDGFDPRRTWRVLAVCRPRGVAGEPPTHEGCRWQGDTDSATVRFRWDPTTAERRRSFPGWPKADAAITPESSTCVPVTLGVEVVDSAGNRASAPGGRIARRCDADTEDLGRTVYLDPRPPAAPRDVQVLCTSPARGLDVLCDGRNDLTLLWEDRSNNEQGFRIYARLHGLDFGTEACDFEAKVTPWVELATIRPGDNQWEFSRRGLSRTLGSPWDLKGNAELSVAAYNGAGEARSRGEVYVHVGGADDIAC